MKRIVLAVLLLGAAFYGYHLLQHHGAYTACEGFAEAWARENRTAAAKFADDETVRDAFERGALRGTEGGAAMEAFRGTSYATESKERKDGGDVVFVLRQTIFFDPPGVTTGIGGAMYARFRHTITARKTPDGWRVVAFEREYLEMGPLRRRRP